MASTMTDAWIYLVFKRSLFDILISIIVFHTEENTIDSNVAIQMNFLINVYYTKILVTSLFFCVLAFALSTLMYEIHLQNIFTDLKKPSIFVPLASRDGHDDGSSSKDKNNNNNENDDDSITTQHINISKRTKKQRFQEIEVSDDTVTINDDDEYYNDDGIEIEVEDIPFATNEK